MKKDIINVDKEKGIFQVTTVDERWYAFPSTNKGTRLPEYRFVPSVTWISGYYPKGVGFYKWLSQHGWDEAEAIKVAAGDKGSKVHNAIEMLLLGNDITPETEFENRETGVMEKLSVEEYEAVLSYADWHKELCEKHEVEILMTEQNVVSEKHNYAGTTDLILSVDGETWIVDFKTSQNVFPEHEIQISAYKHALIEEGKIEDAKLIILQVGYRRNKRRHKANEIEDKFDLFLTAQKIWANENDGTTPAQKDYPMEISLKVTEKLIENENEKSTRNNAKSTSSRKSTRAKAVTR